MVKSDLRENGFFETAKYPKKSGVNAIWISLTVFLIIGTFSGIVYILFVVLAGAGDPPDDALMFVLDSFARVTGYGIIFEIIGYIIFFILLMFAYLFMKLFMTVLFCHHPRSIKMKILEHKGIPLCLCREALKVWQTVLIYVVPIIVMYSFYIFLCIRYRGLPLFVLMLFFALFYIAFDLTLVIYVLAFNLKYKIDYISLDHHIYDVTLY